MKLGMINSFLIVCFTMVQKYSNQKIFTKFVQKYHVMAIRQHLGKMRYIYNQYERKFYQLFFLQFRSTEHL